MIEENKLVSLIEKNLLQTIKLGRIQNIRTENSVMMFDVKTILSLNEEVVTFELSEEFYIDYEPEPHIENIWLNSKYNIIFSSEPYMNDLKLDICEQRRDLERTARERDSLIKEIDDNICFAKIQLIESEEKLKIVEKMV